MSTDKKRQDLREKIEASERRNEQRSAADYALDARDRAVDFVKEHPIATVAGGVALGVLIAALVPGPGRRMRKQATAKGSALAAMLAELGIAYGTGLLDSVGDAARTGKDRLEDFGDNMGDTARSLRREAGYLAGGASESARALRREAGKKAGRTVRDLRARMSH